MKKCLCITTKLIFTFTTENISQSTKDNISTNEGLHMKLLGDV